MPTLLIQAPASSYMPDVIITDNTRSTGPMSSTCLWVRGFFPPFARVAAMMARSKVFTMTEHWRK
ncbi:hypothetical protein D9M72_339440 [compost metagenome]